MHDKNGKLLQVGDEVVLRAKITSITPNPNFCNCSLEFTERMPTGDGEGRVERMSAVNTKMLEKVE